MLLFFIIVIVLALVPVLCSLFLLRDLILFSFSCVVFVCGLALVLVLCHCSCCLLDVSGVVIVLGLC